MLTGQSLHSKISACSNFVQSSERENSVHVRNNGIHYQLFAPRTVLHPRTFLTIQMRSTGQYFHVALFIMLYKVILTFKSVNETFLCDHSNESY